MNKTQRQFLKLGDYIVKNFSPEPYKELEITEKFKFMLQPDCYCFNYYNILIVVMDDRLSVTLLTHIDITDFDKSKLLKDMWADVINYNRVENIMKEIAPTLAEIFDNCGKTFTDFSNYLSTITNKKNGKDKRRKS